MLVDDMVDAFQACKHPEVLDGSRREEDVRREFCDSFTGMWKSNCRWIAGLTISRSGQCR